MAIAVDPSTPALATVNSGNVAATAPFTPPANAVLAGFAWLDTSNGNLTSASAMSDTQSRPWTIQATRAKPDSGAQNGHVQVSTAVTSTSTSMTTTSTGSGNGGSLAAGLYCMVLTGVDTANPVDAIAEGSSASGVISQLLTTVTDGALIVLINSDWNVAATPTPAAGFTTIVGTGLGVGPDLRIWLVRQTALQSPPGAVTVASTAPSTGNTNNWIAVAFKPAAGGGSTPISVSDTGSETESVAVAATTPLADSGTGAQALAVTATAPFADAATAADTVTVAAAGSLTDSGSATQTFTVAASAGLADAAVAADALTTTAAVSLTDTGSASEALTASTIVALADTGSATDSLLAGIGIFSSDVGSAAEALGVNVAAPMPDAGSGAEAFTATASAGLTDIGSASDSLTATVTIALTDTAVGGDAFAHSVLVFLADSGSATDLLATAGSASTPIPARYARFGVSRPFAHTDAIRPSIHTGTGREAL